MQAERVHITVWVRNGTSLLKADVWLGGLSTHDDNNNNNTDGTRQTNRLSGIFDKWVKKL